MPAHPLFDSCQQSPLQRHTPPIAANCAVRADYPMTWYEECYRIGTDGVGYRPDCLRKTGETGHFPVCQRFAPRDFTYHSPYFPLKIRTHRIKRYFREVHPTPDDFLKVNFRFFLHNNSKIRWVFPLPDYLKSMSIRFIFDDFNHPDAGIRTNHQQIDCRQSVAKVKRSY